MVHLLGEEKFSFDTRGGQIHVHRSDTTLTPFGGFEIAKRIMRENIVPIASDNRYQTKETGFRTIGITSETRIQRTDNCRNNILPELK